jgi:formate dehydrogenase
MSDVRLSFCHICEQTCGLAVSVEDGRITRIRPDKEHPYSWRDFCIKGARAHELVYDPRRITRPMRRVGDHYEPASYEEAITDIAARLEKIIAEHGPHAVGAYGGNPQFTSFDGSTFMTAFLKAVGTRNWFWVGSIDTNPMQVVAELMHGSPWLFTSIDVDPCRCFLLIGTNPAESTHCWAGHVPDGWKRVLAAQDRGADLIVVDPRRTPTAAKANLHIAIKPGEDWAFLLGVVKVVLANGWLHADDCDRSRGLDVLRGLAESVSLADLSARCEVAVEQMQDVAQRFAKASAAHCVTRTGPAQTKNGALAEWLSNVLNFITGRYERPGGRVYNPGLFDQIKAADSMLPPSKTPSRVRGIVPVAGAHALAELPDEINTPGQGQIKALIIQAGNPVNSGPDGAALDEALSKLDLLVAVDLVQRESHRHAHWLIPGVHFLERTEVNPLLASLHDRPFVQMARAVIDRPPTVRPEWEFFAGLALKMDVPLLGTSALNRLIRTTRWLAGATGIAKLAFDPSWLSWMMVRSGKRVKWRDIATSPHGVFYGERTYGNLWHCIRTSDKRVDLAPDLLVKRLKQCLAEAPGTSPAEFPQQMISRRRLQNMNSWLVETTGKSIKPFTGDVVEINAGDAVRLGIADGQAVRVVSRIAAVEARAVVSDRIRSGVVAFEQGWGSSLLDPSGRSAPELHGINRNLLVANDDIDPISGVPQLNGTRVRLEKCG